MAGQRRSGGVIVDDAAFLRGLQAATVGLVARAESDLIRLAQDVQNRARTFCPVDTGTLRRSIGTTHGRTASTLFALVGTNVAYSRFVEYGTRYQRAQPYMRPALALAVAAYRPGR